MNYENLFFEKRNSIAYVTVNRPKVLNALNMATMEELRAIDREKQLRRWVRRKKIALIESKNPRWIDLAEKWGAQMAFAGESIKTK